MDYREVINWLISPLPPVFNKNTKGEVIQQKTLADRIAKGWKLAKKVFWISLVLALFGAAFKLYQLIKYN